MKSALYVVTFTLVLMVPGNIHVAMAFSLAGSQWPQPGGDGSPITLTYSYNNFLDGGLKNLDGMIVPANYLREVTLEAFGLWSTVAPLHFVEVPDIGSDVFEDNSSDYVDYSAISPDSIGTIRLNHLFINGSDQANGSPTTKARAFFPNARGNLAEVEQQEERRVAQAIRISHLPTGPTISNFDFAFQPSVSRCQIETLATGQWLRDGLGLLLQGPPGVGKTHLAIGLAMRASETGFSVRFYRLDELMHQLEVTGWPPITVHIVF